MVCNCLVWAKVLRNKINSNQPKFMHIKVSWEEKSRFDCWWKILDSPWLLLHSGNDLENNQSRLWYPVNLFNTRKDWENLDFVPWTDRCMGLGVQHLHHLQMFSTSKSLFDTLRVTFCYREELLRFNFEYYIHACGCGMIRQLVIWSIQIGQKMADLEMWLLKGLHSTLAGGHTFSHSIRIGHKSQI